MNKITLGIYILIVITLLWIIYTQKGEIKAIKSVPVPPSVELTNKIKTIKDEIAFNERELERIGGNNSILKLREICLKKQLSMLVDGLEYNIEYCYNNENLKQFQAGE